VGTKPSISYSYEHYITTALNTLIIYQVSKNNIFFEKVNFFIDFLVSFDEIVKIMATKAKKPGKSRSQKRVKRTRRKLKEAALDVFSEKTVDAATVEEITEKADLGKGTLYQHFSDKEDIVVTLVDEAVNHLIEHIGASTEHPLRIFG
jgi:hypothetical protein